MSKASKRALTASHKARKTNARRMTDHAGYRTYSVFPSNVLVPVLTLAGWPSGYPVTALRRHLAGRANCGPNGEVVRDLTGMAAAFGWPSGQYTQARHLLH